MSAVVKSNPLCRSQVAVQCECGRRKETVACAEAANSYQRSALSVFSFFVCFILDLVWHFSFWRHIYSVIAVKKTLSLQAPVKAQIQGVQCF